MQPAGDQLPVRTHSIRKAMIIMAQTAVIYARYSSDKQREASIEDQIRVCREYCDSEKIAIVREYADYAITGKTDDRPQFRQMIANAPEAELVVVYMFDRFSRNRYDSATYKQMLRDCGVRVVSATEHIEDTPEGGLQEGLLEILSEYYVKDLARKVRRGMEGNALKAMNNGYKIFGYDTDPDTRRYIVNESEAACVREVFSRCIAGESLNSISRSLASRGWRTSTGRPVDYNWARRLITRRAYTGLYSWGDIEIDGGMPVLVDSETFERAQRVPRAKIRANENWADYKLSGKLFCGICGMPMHGYGGTGRGGRSYFYYGCKQNGGCKRPGTRKELLESAVANAVMEITSDEEHMRVVAKRIVEAYREDDTSREELDRCEEAIRNLEKEQHNLTKAVTMGFCNEEIIARNNEIKEELTTLHERRGILMSETMEITEDDIVEFFAHGFNRDDEDFIFGDAVNQVWLFYDCAVVVFNFRNADGDLAEIRIALDALDKKKKNANQKWFASFTDGVPYNRQRRKAIRLFEI